VDRFRKENANNQGITGLPLTGKVNRKKVLFDEFFQFFRVKGFCQKILCPQFVTADTFIAAFHAGEHDHGCMFCISSLSEFLEEKVAIHIWHLDIANDQVGKVPFQPQECFEPIVLANDLISFREEILQEQAYAGFVINDKDLILHITLFILFSGQNYSICILRANFIF